MKRWIAMLSVLGLFLMGILIGALGMQLWQSNRPDAGRNPMRPGGSGGPPGMHDTLSRKLDLTPEQREQVRTIFEESRLEARRLHEEMLPRVREHMQSTRERIREILTPEQQERFDRFDRHDRRAIERMFLGGVGRRHGPRRGGRRPEPPGPPPGE